MAHDRSSGDSKRTAGGPRRGRNWSPPAVHFTGYPSGEIECVL